MMRILLFALLQVSLIGPLSCVKAQDDSTPSPRSFQTKTGKTIIISETHPVGRSLSNIGIRTKGFAHDSSEIYEDRDPISDVFLADLDNNGFDEIYIITTAAGSGSYGTVLGFASNKDKSISMIHFPDIQNGDSNFSGYMGHDAFSIAGQKLIRIFPVYQKDDPHQSPSGGIRKLIYGLYPGEAMWQLKTEASEMIEPE